jgi:aspartyl-tRNA(Asn)/glutamyl-tRNA(Gln) amidotransferase subunit A
MHEQRQALTLDELRDRIRAAGVQIPEARRAMVRRLVDDALAPVRAMDARALRTLEPAVTFSASGAAERGPAMARPGPSSAGDAGRTAPAETPDTPADALPYATIRELGRRFRRRDLSPVELTAALLERINRLDPRLHAFVTLTAERALADAKAAEAALMSGRDGGPLLGIPVAYKDLYATRGIRTTAGSALLADFVPEADGTCVARLAEAGSVMLGKLITHEFALGIQFPGHRFPPARNPWNLDHIPGGSSSGSGAALAAGLAYGALGSDTGGSIRNPASFCAVVGLKPTYGRLSRAGVVALSWTLDHAGPMARTVEDCALLYQALAGHDPADPASSRVPVDDTLAGLDGGARGLRVGVPRDYFFEGADPEVAQAFEAALGTFRALGATVRDVEIPAIWSAPAFMVILLTEAFAYHERDLRERPELYGEVFREKLLAGALFSGWEYTQAQRLRARLAADIGAALSTVDVLMTPTTATPAPSFAAALDPEAPFARSNPAPFNMAGLPALALPCGFTRAGLPVSLQIAGRAFDEATVLRAGRAYEQATAWHRRRAV